MMRFVGNVPGNMGFRRIRQGVATFFTDVADEARSDWEWLLRQTTARLDRVPWRIVAALGAGVAIATVLVGPSPAVSGNDPFSPQPVAAVTPTAGAAFSAEPGRSGVEASARALAAEVGIPLATSDWRHHLGDITSSTPSTCPASRLEVQWVAPPLTYQVGAHVEPLGPVPEPTTDRVNGIVVCRDSTYGYLGFEAAYTAGRWRLSAVPALAAEEGAELLPGEAAATGAVPAAAPGSDGATGAAALPAISLWDSVGLDEPAIHVPQLTCDPAAKPGALGFRDLLMTAFPMSRNLGIGRACEAPGVSEHKEGRAFDWGVRTSDPVEKAAADAVLGWLLGPDAQGRQFAIARRVGLMYVIWDGHIWSAERAVDGWRPYVGVSDHTDHIHFSFSWPGARAETSFWTGELREHLRDNAPDLPLIVPTLPTLPALLPPGLAPPMSGAPPESTTTTTTAPPPTTTTTSTTTTTAPPPSTTTTTTTTMPPPPTVTLPPIGSGSGGSSTLGF
jgi:hypothetical protein